MTKMVDMTPEEWAAIPGNPRQRNTEERLKHALEYLIPPLEVHATVAMGILPDGSAYKLDGHTRSLFWQQHPQHAPATVHANEYDCKNIAEVRMLYDTFDSAKALETAPDKIFGSLREAEFTPASAFIRKAAKLAAAMRLAYSAATHTVLPNGNDVHELTEFWLPELKALDALDCNRAFFNGPIVTAALLTLRKHNVSGKPEKAAAVFAFWDAYNRNAGQKTETAMNGVEALHKITTEYETQKNRHRSVVPIPYKAGRAIHCVEAHLAERSYPINPKGGKITVREMKAQSYISGPPKEAKRRDAPAARAAREAPENFDTQPLPMAASAVE